MAGENSTELEVGNLEFVILVGLAQVLIDCRGSVFPTQTQGESMRDAISRQWAILKPTLAKLAKNLDLARAEGRLDVEDKVG